MNQIWVWLLAAIIAFLSILIGGFAGFAIATFALGITGMAWAKTRAGPKPII